MHKVIYKRIAKTGETPFFSLNKQEREINKEKELTKYKKFVRIY